MNSLARPFLSTFMLAGRNRSDRNCSDYSWGGTPIVKLVAGAWRKFKEWGDMHKRKEVEEKTRESVLDRLSELKKETAERPRNPVVSKKQRGTELE